VVRGDGRRGLMRLLEWINYVEVVDPETGRPVAPGEEGEIVLTNLDIEGSPVLRFSTRDRARFVPWHECGGGRAWNCLETGTIGRYDDMLKIRGNNVWPLAVDTAVFAEAEVAEYVGRVFVDESGRTRVALRLALKDAQADMAADARRALTGRLAQRIKERTNVQMELEIVPRRDLPEFTYKARRWTDERREGLKA
jgi:phenylacetate-CoA ligase